MSGTGELCDIKKNPPRWMTCAESHLLFTGLAKAGGEGRFVGGCVRDALLGVVSDDIDVCTNLEPEIVMSALSGAGIRVIPTGLKHGTVTALVGAYKYEITTLRVDVETDGRHAKVHFTTDWREDAARRDFTINALYLTEKGELHDYFDGMQDLKAGTVKFIGDADARIEE
ncbi:MAG: CCA tRNA nucleotidyltransferase, partial [Sneathiella sp.]|nr:CCA tRNA nucleotidyltransferase [Sneathiella sp.]